MTKNSALVLKGRLQESGELVL